MRRILLALTAAALQLTIGAVLLLSFMPAGAQPVVFPLPPCIARPALPPPPITAPPGLPLAWGGRCSLEVESNDVGHAYLLLCPRPGGGAPTFDFAAVRRSALTRAMLLDAAAVPVQAMASGPDAVRAFRAKYATTHVLDMCDVWGPARERFNAAYAAATTPVQPAPAWKVATFGVQQTRPAFSVAAGRRGAQSPTRAPVGASCDCAAPIVESSATYCPWAGSGGLITVCVKP